MNETLCAERGLGRYNVTLVLMPEMKASPGAAMQCLLLCNAFLQMPHTVSTTSNFDMQGHS